PAEEWERGVPEREAMVAELNTMNSGTRQVGSILEGAGLYTSRRPNRAKRDWSSRQSGFNPTRYCELRKSTGGGSTQRVRMSSRSQRINASTYLSHLTAILRGQSNSCS